MVNGGSVGRRPKLAVALTFPVYPPRGGGQVRVFHLFRALSRAYDVELVTLGLPGGRASHREIAPGLWETCVPKSSEHARREYALEAEAGTLVTDVAMPVLYELTPAYLEALRQATRGVRAAVASHPYALPAIRAVTDAPLWYESHNVEVLLKASILSGNAAAERLLREVERVERGCCEQAEVISACSEEDRAELTRRYGVKAERIHVVPIGVDLSEHDYVPLAVRREHQRRLGMQRCLTVFIGSWHEPNIAAVKRLIDLAPSCPGIDFLCLGSVGTPLRDRTMPDNVDLAGPFAPEFRRAVLSVADFALNPVITGSGTNVKMLDYLAAGTPVVSTEFGARGLGIKPGEHYEPANPDDFGRGIAAARATAEEDLARRSDAARALVEETLDWRVIGDRVLTSFLDG